MFAFGVSDYVFSCEFASGNISVFSAFRVDSGFSLRGLWKFSHVSYVKVEVLLFSSADVEETAELPLLQLVEFWTVVACPFSIWPCSVGWVVKMIAFLGTLHWPAVAGDLCVCGFSYVELFTSCEFLAGERLVLGKGFLQVSWQAGASNFSVGCSSGSQHRQIRWVYVQGGVYTAW